MNAPVLGVQYMDQTYDPARLGWPATLPLELALSRQSVREVCEAYGIDRAEYEQLKADPNFRHAVEEALETFKAGSATFKLKARAQAEEMLKTSWNLVHQPLDKVSAAVKADLIKFTIRAAGLDASVEQKVQAQATAASASLTALQINLHLSD